MIYINIREYILNEGYELVRQELIASRDLSILVLGRDGEKGTFIDQLAKDHHRREEAAAITRIAVRLVERGTTWALDCRVLKQLNTQIKDPAIYELKIMRTRYRVMTYLHDDQLQTPVLLFDFLGHRGMSRGGIRKATLQKGIQLARIACRLMNEEEEAR